MEASSVVFAPDLGRFDDAEDAYRRALALAPPSYEDPLLLLERRRRVKSSRRPA